MHVYELTRAMKKKDQQQFKRKQEKLHPTYYSISSYIIFLLCAPTLSRSPVLIAVVLIEAERTSKSATPKRSSSSKRKSSKSGMGASNGQSNKNNNNHNNNNDSKADTTSTSGPHPDEIRPGNSFTFRENSDETEPQMSRYLCCRTS